MVCACLDQGERICTLGPIIHNTQLVDELASRGARVVDTPEQCRSGERIVLRSHGVTLDSQRTIEALGLDCVDATCPFVKKIHHIVSSADGGALVVVAGDRSHPEVQAIASRCGGTCLVVPDAEAMLRLQDEIKQSCSAVILVAQTTFDANEWIHCTQTLKKICTSAKKFDTICNAPAVRQREAEKLARVSDLMVVVGGRHSSNTAKLADICRRHCKTIHVETAAELDRSSIQGYRRIGITAGASTPDRIIKEVQQAMSEILENKDELSFEEMLDQSFKSTYNGERVVGTVTGISPTEVSVDIGTKHAGYIPLSELSEDSSAKPEELVQRGDQLELMVVRVNDIEGTVMLSKKRLDALAGFEKVMSAVDTGEVLEGVVTDVIKGGMLVLTNGVKVFIPASQATVVRADDLSWLLRQKVKFKILEVNRQRRRAVGSVRAAARELRKAQEEAFWVTVQEGTHYEGTVKSLTDYGAFIDLGGVDGMVHISELSWGKIRHPSQVVKVGDRVNVFVKHIDPDNRKISLGYKKDEDNPWTILQNNYQIGQDLKVKIVSLTAFGAFAEGVPGVDGLIHISQIALHRVGKPADVLTVGQEVEARITELDFDRKRVNLSIRAILEERAAEQGDVVEPEAPEAKEPSQAESETGEEQANQ
jgi:4-hydroxy-3-methylbut-2-enyl diphosphate reductase